MKQFFLLLALITQLYTQAQNKLHPVDGIKFINERFKEYPIIALGESHALKEQYDLLQKLVKNKFLQNTVDFIVVEFGNKHYQSILNEKELNRRSKIRFNNDLNPKTRLSGKIRPIGYN